MLFMDEMNGSFLWDMLYSFLRCSQSRIPSVISTCEEFHAVNSRIKEKHGQ